MNNELQTKLDAIKLDKDTNLKPEHLKAGITCLGVNGTYEGSGGGTTEGIKQFSTVEEMQADTNPKECDLAIVYRSEITNATVDSTFSTAIFPETVVLDEAITDYIEVRYRAVDSSKMFDCWGMLDSNMFSMDCYTESGSIRIEYESSDGITYTRTDTTGNPVDFSTEIYYRYTQYWNDVIGKFIQVGGSTFDGLFEYKRLTDNTRFQFRALDTLQYNSETSTISMVDNLLDTVYDFTTLSDLRSTMWQAGAKTVLAYLDNDDNLCFIGEDKENYSISTYFIGENGELSHIGYAGTTVTKFYIYKINLENNSYELSKTINAQTTTSYGGTVTKCIPFSELNAKSLPVALNQSNGPVMYMEAYSTSKSVTFSDTKSSIYNKTIGYTYNSYVVAPNQFTALKDYVYSGIYYGKDGVNQGTLTESPSDTFADTNAEVYYKIRQYYDNMEPRVLTDDDKTIDTNIYLIPTKSDGTPLLDTSSVTDASSMFRKCTNLTTIPLLDTSNVTDVRNMFEECTNLTTIPLLDTSSVTNARNMFLSCTSLTAIPLLDTSSVTDMSYLFYNCTNLITIPLLDTSNTTDMAYMLSDCTNLTEDSLNNILAICKNATKYTKTKTLKYIGLTSEQANICKTLSNYSAFTSAGWTTGY